LELVALERLVMLPKVFVVLEEILASFTQSLLSVVAVVVLGLLITVQTEQAVVQVVELGVVRVTLAETQVLVLLDKVLLVVQELTRSNLTLVLVAVALVDQDSKVLLEETLAPQDVEVLV
jgi:hypothetical protein